jgi:hypothetical protein
VTQYLSTIARQFAATGSGARVAWGRTIEAGGCAATGDIRAANQIRTKIGTRAEVRAKGDFVKNRKGRMQRSSRLLGELCVEEETGDAAWRQLRAGQLDTLSISEGSAPYNPCSGFFSRLLRSSC